MVEGKFLFQCNKERKKGSYVDLVSKGHEVIFETETDALSFWVIWEFGDWL